MTLQRVTPRVFFPMKAQYLLLASLVFAAVAGCDDGTRSRFAANPPSTPTGGQLQSNLPDAAVIDTVEHDAGVTPPPSEPSDPVVGRPSSRTEEIDNTIYWDAATKPTADNVHGVDAGEPDR
jgi:hypothetical protein